ncbi:MAG: hypothetical protein KA716_27945 [Gloeotrichia echinulata DEX184]|jgi:uncharacterized protein YukE|nr:hypothetical protein [Gloeotrichia echinulata DEX184]
MNKILTKIQSRLNRRGIKVSLGDIREKYLTAVLDYDNPTEDELSDVVDYFVRLTTLPVPIGLEPTSAQIETVEIPENETDNYNQQNAITPASKSELVSSAAQSLGIVLNTQEISEIANNVKSSSEELDDSLDEIKSAIVAFIKYKASLNSEKISQIVKDINQIAASEFNQNSQELTDGLQAINQQLQQQSTNFKSQVKSALAALAIPSKAG